MTLPLVALSSVLAFSAGQFKPPTVDPEAARQAKVAFTRAQQLYKEARYADAIAKFEEAFALRPHPVIYFNIGRCWEQLGETAKALRAYRDYLRLMPDATDKDTVNDAIANLERRLKERGLGQLMVFTDPATAQIEVDGKALGNSPASVELTVGNHRLSVKADGYEPSERSFVMQTQRSTEITVSLRKKGEEPPPAVVVIEPKPAPPAAAAAPATPAPAPAPVVAPTQSAAHTPAPVVVQAPVGQRRLITWAALGGSIVAVGAGVALGIVANGAVAELRGSLHDSDTATALVNRAEGFALGANIAYGVAAAAGIAAIVLFFVEGRLSGVAAFGRAPLSGAWAL
jgi:hypothetical protein